MYRQPAHLLQYLALQGFDYHFVQLDFELVLLYRQLVH